MAKESHQDRYSGQPGAEEVEHFRGDQDQTRIFRRIEAYVVSMRLKSKASKEHIFVVVVVSAIQNDSLLINQTTKPN